MNMAIDEALASCARKAGGVPTLRLYSFDPPCITIGRFQRPGTLVDEEACARAGVEITRRPTGGLAILHKDDFTYAVTCPTGDAGSSPDHYFRMIASGVTASLERLGIEAVLASHNRRRSSPGWCFDREFGVDIEWRARKICGSAQRISKGSLLQHGSLFLADNSALIAGLSRPGEARAGAAPVSVAEACGRRVSREEMAEAFREGFSGALGVRMEEGRLSEDEEGSAAELAAAKYADPRWLAGD
jgi:lipoyl(octanoyl) transferase